MNTINPVPGNLPSNSTIGSGVGGALAALVIWGLSLKGIFLPAGLEALVAGLTSAIAGYLPNSGRK